MKNLDEILVERVDILSEMNVLNKRCREIGIKGCKSEEEIKAYDTGVKNTMSALASVLDHGNKEDRLIFQKYGLENECGIVFHMRLSDILDELYGGD